MDHIIQKKMVVVRKGGETVSGLWIEKPALESKVPELPSDGPSGTLHYGAERFEELFSKESKDEKCNDFIGSSGCDSNGGTGVGSKSF